MPELEILIPVYNEGLNILNVLEALKEKVKTPFCVLIAYDRDEDDTLPVIQNNLAHLPQVRLVKNKTRGVHGAIVSAFQAGDAPAVIVFPADDTYNAGMIDGMVREFKNGAEIVSASRFMRGGCMKGCPWLKAFLVRMSAFTLYHLAQLPTHDPTNGFRLFSRRVIREVPIESTEGFAFSIELLVKCHRLGWKITELPALWFERSQGRSRFRILRWMPIYLRWYFYAFATALFGRAKAHADGR